MYYGRALHLDATPGNATAIVNGQRVILDVGEYLDSVHGGPLSRFDVENNFMFSSREAEIIYFLRPKKAQFGPGLMQTDPLTDGAAPPSVPALFTLYRRVLLVAENAPSLNRGSAQAPAGVALNDPAPFNPYAYFDLSISREFERLPNLTQWLFAPPANPNDMRPRLHFNSLRDLAQREYRYGMLIGEFTNPARAQYDQLHGANGTNPPPQWSYRAVPMSHQDTNAAGIPFAHEYNPLGAAEPWFGRPTLAESSHPAFPFWNEQFMGTWNGNATTTVQLVDADQNGVLDAYQNPPANQLAFDRAGDDILLDDVVSFDVQVIEDMPGASAAVNPLQTFNFSAGVFGGGPNMTNQIPFTLRRPEHVDLGYYADIWDPYDSSAPAGDVTAANPNVLITAPYPLENPEPRWVAYARRLAPFGVLMPRAPAEIDPAVVQLGPNGVDDMGAPTGDDLSAQDMDILFPPAVRDFIENRYLIYLRGPDDYWGPDPDAPNAQTDSRLYNPNPPSDDVPLAQAQKLFWKDFMMLRYSGPNLDPAQGNRMWGPIARELLAKHPGNFTDVADDNVITYGQNPLPNFFYPNAPSPNDYANWWEPPLFGRSGQVGFRLDLGADQLGYNLGNANPRNTYDTWSAAYTTNPWLSVDPNNPSRDGFRPVPYARPLRGIQVTIRILEPKSQIVREVTIRHDFKKFE
jgi:hypothetical protein